MSDAYSIQAKLQLDTSKFTSEINKITKNINTLSKTLSSMLGGEFEKTTKSVKSASKTLNNALGEDFKKSTRKSVHQFKNIEKIYGTSLSNMTRSTRKRIDEMNAQMTKAANPLVQMAAKGAAVAGVFALMRKGMERFNIINSFPAQMLAFGISADIASSYVKKLSGDIVGLPVSLADAVDQTKMLYMATFDLDKSTSIVTALNASYASSGAGANECYYATKRFTEALQSGKMSGEDFDLILRGMGPAMLTVAGKFGYCKNKLNDFRSSLISGEISMGEFSNKLVEAKDELVDMGRKGASSLNTVIANLNNAFGALGQEIIGVMDKISIAITGVNLQTNIANITESIKGFTKSLKDNLKEEDIKNIFSGLKDAFENIKGAIKSVKEGILNFKNFLNSLGFSDAQLIQFALQLSVAMIGMKIAFKTLVPAIKNVMGAFNILKVGMVALSNPFGLLIAFVVLLAVLFITHWGEICTFFESAKNIVCAIFSAIGQFFADAWGRICENFTQAGEDLCAIGNAIGAGLSAVWNWICSTSQWLWDSIVNTIVGIWNGLISSASKTFEDIKATIVGIWDSISSKASEIWEGIKSTIKGVWNSIKDIFDKVTGFFGGGGAKAAAVSLTEESINVEDLTRTYTLNHNFDALKNFSPGEFNANVSVSAPAPNVYVLLDGSEIATKSFDVMDNLINSKILINKTKLSGAM